jgi:hypothetical protein
MSFNWRDAIYCSTLFQNMGDVQESYLIHMDTQEVTRVDINVIKLTLNQRNEFQEYCEANGLKGTIEYRPKDQRRIIMDPTAPPILNLYTPPPWLRDHFYFGEPLPTREQPPVIVERFLTHLTDGDDKSKSYLYDWAATSLRDRNFTFLTALGAPGIGKGLLYELLERVHGNGNATAVRDTVFKAKFNSQLANKTLVCVDEFQLREKEDIDRVKDVANKAIEVERKGVDAQRLPNYASFYFTSNHVDAIRLGAGDRRFSIITLTERSLLEIFNQAEIDELVSEETAAQLGAYLMSHVIVNDMKKPFTDSENYLSAADASLHEWERNLMNIDFPLLKPGDFVTVQQVKDMVATGNAYMARPPGRPKLQEFAQKFPKLLKFCKHEGVRGILIKEQIIPEDGVVVPTKTIGLVK